MRNFTDKVGIRGIIRVCLRIIAISLRIIGVYLRIVGCKDYRGILKNYCGILCIIVALVGNIGAVFWIVSCIILVTSNYTPRGLKNIEIIVKNTSVT